jgi:hypothetical protein
MRVLCYSGTDDMEEKTESIKEQGENPRMGNSKSVQ